MKNNTSLPDVIPSSHHQSQTGVAASSSPTLEIGEILELVELKDDEPALLSKALELYPQLRLSHGQRTRSVIAFSYRVLTDILVMLATKTPHAITTSEKSTLEKNLGTATFLGFDKGWIESVRDKVSGNDMFDVTKVEEKIQEMKEELETRHYVGASSKAEGRVSLKQLILSCGVCWKIARK
ncbi:uncharacterized protein LOC114756612 [Neltuma alba]|uniref:uncharacterized protein LOC114756612 n=1 Tax=Neltuma alba TaxID=207710 RepID=UPI0010A313C8|nr:uncharacterized protein LOC114756612 [Prosopis alba]